VLLGKYRIFLVYLTLDLFVWCVVLSCILLLVLLRADYRLGVWRNWTYLWRIYILVRVLCILHEMVCLSVQHIVYCILCMLIYTRHFYCKRPV